MGMSGIPDLDQYGEQGLLVLTLNLNLEPINQCTYNLYIIGG